MAHQNKISYGFAPPSTERGYGPKSAFSSLRPPRQTHRCSSTDRQLTVDARTFGTEFSNNFQRHDVGHMQIDKSSTENLRLWQLMVKVAYDSKELVQCWCLEEGEEGTKDHWLSRPIGGPRLFCERAVEHLQPVQQLGVGRGRDLGGRARLPHCQPRNLCRDLGCF